MPAELKFCKDCEHKKYVAAGNVFFCLKPETYDLVTGYRMTHLCADERSTGDCGPDAKNFKPKQETSK